MDYIHRNSLGQLLGYPAIDALIADGATITDDTFKENLICIFHNEKYDAVGIVRDKHLFDDIFQSKKRWKDARKYTFMIYPYAEKIFKKQQSELNRVMNIVGSYSKALSQEEENDQKRFLKFMTNPNIETVGIDFDVIRKAMAFGLLDRLNNQTNETTLIAKKQDGDFYLFIYFNPVYYKKDDSGYLYYRVKDAAKNSSLFDELMFVVSTIHKIKFKSSELFDCFESNIN